jgi:hypothetical protein
MTLLAPLDQHGADLAFEEGDPRRIIGRRRGRGEDDQGAERERY